MAKDTVILSIEEYNRLRDFENNMKKDCVLIVTSDSCYSQRVFVTKDEAVKILAKENLSYKEKFVKLKMEDPISKLKKMSIWQFLKWRKS